MQTITIVIQTLPRGKGCSVLTDSAPPAIGHPRTEAQELANKLLRVCASQAASVQYGTTSASLAGELVQASADQKTRHYAGYIEPEEIRAHMSQLKKPTQETAQ